MDFYSTPDGSCLLAIIPLDDGGHQLAAYHWSSFGANKEGIRIAIPPVSSDVTFGVTSLGTRLAIQFFALSPSVNSVQSMILQIRMKSSVFQFKELGMRVSERDQMNTTNNCLIDCHLDVWTRFPVVPAVRRRTVKSSTGRLPRSIIFVSTQNAVMFQSHFANLIDTFERTTRKPTETELSSIHIFGTTYGSFMKRSTQNVSAFKAGEWLVDLLCLIPIHIAVTRDNRFMPLKDGVWSSQLERDLLGATVDQIIDGLSCGWYESIFQSYMASKVSVLLRSCSLVD